MQIQDKRIVVTGAASGIGKALCEAFNKAGAKSIVCVDMNMEGATETANEINGLDVHFYCTFSSNYGSIYMLVRKLHGAKNEQGNQGYKRNR